MLPRTLRPNVWVILAAKSEAKRPARKRELVKIWRFWSSYTLHVVGCKGVCDAWW